MNSVTFGLAQPVPPPQFFSGKATICPSFGITINKVINERDLEKLTQEVRGLIIPSEDKSNWTHLHPIEAYWPLALTHALLSTRQQESYSEGEVSNLLQHVCSLFQDLHQSGLILPEETFADHGRPLQKVHPLLAFTVRPPLEPSTYLLDVRRVTPVFHRLLMDPQISAETLNTALDNAFQAIPTKNNAVSIPTYTFLLGTLKRGVTSKKATLTA